MSGSESRLISPAALSDAEAASDLLSAAHREVEALRDTAEEHATRIEREARQRGEALGLRALMGAAKELRAERRSWLEDLEPQLIELTVNAARAVVDAAAVDGRIAAETVRARLDRLEPGPTIRIMVHPEDVDAVRAATGRAGHPELKIVAEPAIERGGCVIDSPGELYDGRIETRLEQLRQALTARGES